MTYDVPFEESLGLFLLDAKLDCIDSARIGCMYAKSIFANLTLMEPNTIRFQFIGEYNWTVVVHQKPQWRIPLFFSQPWISRHFQLTGHFSVRRRIGNSTLPRQVSARFSFHVKRELHPETSLAHAEPSPESSWPAEFGRP
jgi:hypothetical protein